MLILLKCVQIHALQHVGQNIVKNTASATNGHSGPKNQSTMPGQVELIVHKDAFWVRLFLFADIGFAEATPVLAIRFYGIQHSKESPEVV